MSTLSGSRTGAETMLTKALVSLEETGVGKKVLEVIGDSHLDFSSLSSREKQLLITVIQKGYLKWFLIEKIQNIPLFELCKTGLPVAVRNEEQETIFLSHSSQIPNREHKAQMFWRGANFEINFSVKQIQIFPSNERFIARDLDKAELKIPLPSATYLKDFLDCLTENGFSIAMENGELVLAESVDIITFIEKCTPQ